VSVRLPGDLALATCTLSGEAFFPRGDLGRLALSRVTGSLLAEGAWPLAVSATWLVGEDDGDLFAL